MYRNLALIANTSSGTLYIHESGGEAHVTVGANEAGWGNVGLLLNIADACGYELMDRDEQQYMGGLEILEAGESISPKIRMHLALFDNSVELPVIGGLA